MWGLCKNSIWAVKWKTKRGQMNADAVRNHQQPLFHHQKVQRPSFVSKKSGLMFRCSKSLLLNMISWGFICCSFASLHFQTFSCFSCNTYYFFCITECSLCLLPFRRLKGKDRGLRWTSCIQFFLSILPFELYINSCISHTFLVEFVLIQCENVILLDNLEEIYS